MIGSDLEKEYERVVAAVRALMEDKNHDYGEAWREMRITSITDQILVKAFRIKEIERKSGRLLASEGTASELRDIINYCIFSLILVRESTEQDRESAEP